MALDDLCEYLILEDCKKNVCFIYVETLWKFYVIPKADKMSLSGYKRNEPSKNCHEYLRTIHDKIASDFPNKRNLCDIFARLHLCASSSLFICRTVAPEICYRLGQIEVRWMRKIFPLGIVLLWHRWLNFLPMLLLLLLWHLFFPSISVFIELISARKIFLPCL